MIAAVIFALIFLPPLTAALLRLMGRPVEDLYRIAPWAHGATLALAAVALGNAVQGERFEASVISLGFSGVALGALLDQVSSLMLCVVTLIALGVVQFSRRYLDGDPRQVYFVGWLHITVAAVQLVVVSSNLAMFFLAWFATSMALHRLLLMYPERAGAQRCARKKFLISRLGDIALLAAIVLCAHEFGTVRFASLETILTSGEPYPDLELIGILIALGALTKSAQLPFHSWLPESLETPTPVSALMHAGIINAGGFLLIRLSPLLNHAPTALLLLTLVGALTAVYGMAVMVTQPSIKKRLAYSTVGQMGFMIMQCGLGLYPLAMLHIVAHAFYKANAFLRSGSAMSQARDQIVFPKQRRLSPMFAGATIAAACTAAFSWNDIVASIPLDKTPILAVWVLACLHSLLGTVTVREHTIVSTLLGFCFAVVMLVVYATLCALMTGYLEPQLSQMMALRPALPVWVFAATALTFVVGFLLQILIHVDTGSRFIARAFVHLHNGFYIGAMLDRVIERMATGAQRRSI